MGEEDDKRINDNGVLENGDGISDASSTDSGVDSGNETDSKHSDGKEIIDEVRGFEGRAMSNLPRGCNVFYGNYIDNYDGNRRTRYYLDSYGQLIPSTITNAKQQLLPKPAKKVPSHLQPTSLDAVPILSSVKG